MSGPPSLEPSLVSSVLRLILVDQRPPSSCSTFGLDKDVSFVETGLTARYYGQLITVRGG